MKTNNKNIYKIDCQFFMTFLAPFLQTIMLMECKGDRKKHLVM